MQLSWRRICLLCCKCFFFPGSRCIRPFSHSQRFRICEPRSIVDQVTQFETYLAGKPEDAEWNGSDSLFAFWIGINDVVSGIVRSLTSLLLTRLTSQG